MAQGQSPVEARPERIVISILVVAVAAATSPGPIEKCAVSDHALEALSSGSPHGAAEGVVRIATCGWQVDLHHLAVLLHLPDIEREVIWHGPPTGTDWFWTGDYHPWRSEFGVAAVRLSWRLIPPDHPAAPMHMGTSLNIRFLKSRCPSEAELAAAVGSKPSSGTFPGVDWGAPFQLRGFAVPQQDGEPIAISYTDGDTCSLTIGRVMDW